jgi:hypothetical protein
VLKKTFDLENLAEWVKLKEEKNINFDKIGD